MSWNGARPGGNRLSWLTLRGTTKSVYEWARETGLSVASIYRRKEAGWTDEETLTIPQGGKRDGRTAFCRGCKYLGSVGSMPCCDYMIMTGHARTVYRGIKTDRCPRKLRKAAKKG